MIDMPYFSNRSHCGLLLAPLIGAAVLAFAHSMYAATFTYTGAGSDNLWSNPDNWQGGLLPVSGTENLTIVYDSAADVSTVNDLGSFILQSIELTNTAGEFSIENGSGSLTFANLGSEPTIQMRGFSDLLFGTNVELGATLSVQFHKLFASDPDASVDFSQSIDGTAGLNITGDGRALFSGTLANNYSGLTTVEHGAELLLRKQNALAISGGLFIRGGEVAWGRATPQIADAIDIVIEATPDYDAGLYVGNEIIRGLTLSASGAKEVEVERGIRLYGDVEVLANETGQGAVTFGGAGSINATDLGNSIRTFTVGDGLAEKDLTIFPPLVNGGIQKTGAGTMWIGTPQQFAGGTIVSGGTLRVDPDHLPGDVLNNAVLQFDEPGTYGGDIAGTGLVTVSHTGVLELTGNNSFAGGLQMTNTRAEGSTLVGNTLSLPGDIDTGTHTTNRVLFNQATDGTVNGQISGSGSLEKGLSGTLTLAAANSHSGGTLVTGGTLKLGATDALPAGGDVNVDAGAILDLNSFNATLRNLTGGGEIALGSAQLTLSPGTDQSLDASIAGIGAVTKLGSRTLTIVGPQSYLGGTTLDAGTLALGDNERLADGGSLTIVGGTFDLTTFSETLSEVTMLAGRIKGTGTLTAGAFQLDSGTVNANLAGATSMAKDGSGTLTLTGGTSFTDSVTINDGTLVARTLSLPGEVVNQGVLKIDEVSDTMLPGAITGGGAFEKFGAGTLTLQSANSYTGGTTVSAGSLRQGTAGAIPEGATLSIASTASVELNNFDLRVASLSGQGEVALGSAKLTIDNSLASTFSGAVNGPGSLEKIGEGMLTLSGASTFTGGTVVNAGTLRLLGSERLADAGAIVIDGGSLQINNTETIGTVSLLSGSIAGSGSLIASALEFHSGTVSTHLTGATALFKNGAGTVTLMNSNEYTGGTEVNNGVLVGAAPSSLQGDIANSGMVRFDASHTYSGVISGAGSVEVTGGTVSFSGANTYSGSTTINSAKLVVSTGSLPGDATLASGTLEFNQTFDGAYTGQIEGTGDVSKRGSGELELLNANTFTGSFEIQQGGVALGSDDAFGDGDVRLSDGTAIRAANGPRVIENPVEIAGSLQITGSHDLAFVNVQPILLGAGKVIDSSNSSNTDIVAEFYGDLNSSVSVTAGHLALGDPLSFSGFRTLGALEVADGAMLTLRSAGFVDLSALTELIGGTLNAPQGISLGTGESLVGRGIVHAKTAAQAGSTISATTGNLTLGDADSLSGFFSDGELRTSQFVVTIEDANEAVLGSLTTIGDAAQGGSLVAGTAAAGDIFPHFLLEPGKNLTGRGTVGGNFANKGTVVGDGEAVGERIVFEADWVISGRGWYENTLIEGTFIGGDEPGTIQGENQAFGGAIEIRLGGLSSGIGSNYDQIVDAGTVVFSGDVALNVLPWNGFSPQAGDEFHIMTAANGYSGSIPRVIADPYFTTELGILFVAQIDANTLSLVATPVQDGDFNADGVVNLADYSVWRDNLGASDEIALNGAGDGVDGVDVGDYQVWKAAFGESVASIAASYQVPEPATAFVVGGLLFLACWRRMAPA